MYGAFAQQQRVSTQQEQLTEARQNARLSLDAMIEGKQESKTYKLSLVRLNR